MECPKCRNLIPERNVKICFEGSEATMHGYCPNCQAETHRNMNAYERQSIYDFMFGIVEEKSTISPELKLKL